MVLTKNDILSAALNLPLESKFDVIKQLMSSINDIDQPSFEKEWMIEAEDRIKAYDLGKIDAIPGDLVFNEIKAKYK